MDELQTLIRMPPVSGENIQSKGGDFETVEEQQLRELPPSATLVAKTLEDGEMTSSSIEEESLLPSRTVRYALKRLEESNLVTSRPYPGDPRKRVYKLVK